MVVEEVEGFPLQETAIGPFAGAGSGAVEGEVGGAEASGKLREVTGMSGPVDEARSGEFLQTVMIGRAGLRGVGSDDFEIVFCSEREQSVAGAAARPGWTPPNAARTPVCFSTKEIPASRSLQPRRIWSRTAGTSEAPKETAGAAKAPPVRARNSLRESIAGAPANRRYEKWRRNGNYASAVVGSIMRRMAETLLAGKPPWVAWSRTACSLGAM